MAGGGGARAAGVRGGRGTQTSTARAAPPAAGVRAGQAGVAAWGCVASVAATGALPMATPLAMGASLSMSRPMLALALFPERSAMPTEMVARPEASPATMASATVQVVVPPALAEVGVALSER